MDSNSEQKAEPSQIDNNTELKEEKLLKKTQEDFEEEENDKDMIKKKQKNMKLKILMPSLEGAYVQKEEFSNFQNKDIAEQVIEKFYKKYQEHYRQRYLENFFYEHKEEVWFDDKFNPRTCGQIKESCSKLVQKNFNVLFEQLKDQKNKNFSLDFENFKNLTLIEEQQDIKYYTIKDEFENEFLKSQSNSNYFLVKNIPKSLSHRDIIDSFAQQQCVRNFSLNLAVRYKNYLRQGIIETNKTNDLKKVEEDLKSVSFNYANIEIEKLDLENKSVLFKQFKSSEEVQIYVLCGQKILEMFFKFYNLEIQDFKEFLNQKNMLQKLDIISLVLFKVFQFSLLLKKSFDCSFKINKYQGIMITRNSVLINEQQIDEKKIQEQEEYKNFQQVIENLENSFEKCSYQEDIIHQKFLQKLQGKTKEENDTWPCFRCEKIFVDQNYLINHFVQKHEDIVEKHKKKIFEKEIFKNFQTNEFNNFYINFEQTCLSYVETKKKIVYEQCSKIRLGELKRKHQSCTFNYSNLQLNIYVFILQKPIKKSQI